MKIIFYFTLVFLFLAASRDLLLSLALALVTEILAFALSPHVD